MTNEEGGGRPVAKLFGALLMAVGGLIMGLCGLCSLAFMVTMGAGDSTGMLFLVAIFAGIPIAAGAAIFFVGRSLWRGAQPPL
jgi:hypothetical protein